jgi:hypothetical protein
MDVLGVASPATLLLSECVSEALACVVALETN